MHNLRSWPVQCSIKHCVRRVCCWVSDGHNQWYERWYRQLKLYNVHGRAVQYAVDTGVRDLCNGPVSSWCGTDELPHVLERRGDQHLE